jgi:hypothetical protein
VAVSLLKRPLRSRFRSKTAVMKPFQKLNGHKFITVLGNCHYPTDESLRSGVTVV